jgi:hypothetical protein
MSEADRDARRAERAAIAGDEARFEALLRRALDVRPAVAKPRRAALPRWRLVAGLAATVVLASAVWVAQREPATLQSAVVEHVLHEPQALDPSLSPVSAAELQAVLRPAGAELERPVGAVTYVRLCPFHGRMVAHFVVQGERGPVTVLLLPDEHVAAPTPIREPGFVGTLLPLEIGGSIAVVGRPDERLDVIRDRVAAAVRWKI